MMLSCQDSIYYSCKYFAYSSTFQRFMLTMFTGIHLELQAVCTLFFGSFKLYSLKSLPKTLKSTNAFTFNLVLIYVFFNNFFNSIPTPISDASSKAFTEPATSGCGTTTGPVPIS